MDGTNKVSKKVALFELYSKHIPEGKLSMKDSAITIKRAIDEHIKKNIFKEEDVKKPESKVESKYSTMSKKELWGLYSDVVNVKDKMAWNKMSKAALIQAINDIDSGRISKAPEEEVLQRAQKRNARIEYKSKRNEQLQNQLKKYEEQAEKINPKIQQLKHMLGL